VAATAVAAARGRGAAIDVLAALGDRAAVPGLIQLIEHTPIRSPLDAIGKEDLLCRAAAALGAIGDPAAVAALSALAAAADPVHDQPRAVAAQALATCLAAAPAPRDVDDAVIAALLETIRERNNGELNASCHLAYGRLAQVVAPDRRATLRERLRATPSCRDDRTSQLTRAAALALADGPLAADELRALLRSVLTTLDYDHTYTVRNVRIGLSVAELFPALADPDALTWLTRFEEPTVRARAHALLARLGAPLAPATIVDGQTASGLADAQVIALLAEVHLVGRAALIDEARRRGLAAARPAIVAAAHAVIERARPGGQDLLEPERRVLRRAVAVLRDGLLDEPTVALFDRLLRHSNYHVKWDLLKDPPLDARLLGGMFHVLGEQWGWQERTARAWLAGFRGTAAYDEARARAGARDLEPDEAVEPLATSRDDENAN
jgi:hypothetical protein